MKSFNQQNSAIVFSEVQFSFSTDEETLTSFNFCTWKEIYYTHTHTHTHADSSNSLQAYVSISCNDHTYFYTL